jgi:hypothetical protein
MRIAVSLFAALIALAMGAEVFVVAFFAPVVLYGDDKVLLAWGWIAPLVGFPLGALAAWIVFRLVSGMLSGTLAATSQRWAKTLAAAALAVTVPALGAHFMRTQGDVNVVWSEEVLLSDGSSIVVSRQARGNVLGHPKSRPQDWLPSEFTISTPTSHLSKWQSSLRPLVLDKGSGQSWYLIAEPVDCGKWYQMGQPAPPYELYVHDLQGWKRIPMEDKYVGLAANLLVAPRFRFEDETVSAKAREARNDWGPADNHPIIRSKSRC